MKDPKKRLLNIIEKAKIDISIYWLGIQNDFNKISNLAAIFELLDEANPALLNRGNCVAMINFGGRSFELLSAIEHTSKFISQKMLDDFLKYPTKASALGEVLNILHQGSLISADMSTPDYPITSAQTTAYLIRAEQIYNYNFVMGKIDLINNVTFVLRTLAKAGIDLVNRENFLNLFRQAEQAGFFNLAIHNLNGSQLLDQDNARMILTLSAPEQATQIAAKILDQERAKSEVIHRNRERRLGYFERKAPQPQPVAITPTPTTTYPKPPRINIRRSN